jgi:hypothetical protein
VGADRLGQLLEAVVSEHATRLKRVGRDPAYRQDAVRGIRNLAGAARIDEGSKALT